MLKFSNSQSCKEFTREGDFTRITRFGDSATKRGFAGLYRRISMYGEACKLFHRRSGLSQIPEGRYAIFTLIVNPDHQLPSHVPSLA